MIPEIPYEQIPRQLSEIAWNQLGIKFNYRELWTMTRDIFNQNPYV